MAAGRLSFLTWRDCEPSPETEPETEEGPGPQIPVEEEPITVQEAKMTTESKKEIAINKPTPLMGTEN